MTKIRFSFSCTRITTNNGRRNETPNGYKVPPITLPNSSLVVNVPTNIYYTLHWGIIRNPWVILAAPKVEGLLVRRIALSKNVCCVNNLIPGFGKLLDADKRMSVP
jgi:hypothetical protein